MDSVDGGKVLRDTRGVQLIFGLLMALFANLAWAMPTPDWILFHGGAGYSSMSGVPLRDTPQLINVTVGGTAATHVAGSWLIGISSHFDLSRQINDPAESGGNHSGQRWSILSPSLGHDGGSWVLLADLDFLGSYQFTTPSLSGASVSLGSPFGGRLRVMRRWTEHWWIGGHVQVVSFGSRNDHDVVNRISFRQFSLVLGYLF